MFFRFVGCPPRFQAIAGLGSFSRRKAAFRSNDVSLTAVTSQVAHTTGPSDGGAYAASVLSVVAPSHLGPRSRLVRRPRKFRFPVTKLSSTPKGEEREYDVRAREEGAEEMVSGRALKYCQVELQLRQAYFSGGPALAELPPVGRHAYVQFCNYSNVDFHIEGRH